MWKLSCVDGVASHEVTSGSSGDTADQQSYSESLGIQPSEGGKMGWGQQAVGESAASEGGEPR